MANWIHKVKIKHLLTEKEDYKSIQESMEAIASILEKELCFKKFHWLKKFKQIPKGDDVVSPVDYGNILLDRMFDYADEHRIWIG